MAGVSLSGLFGGASTVGSNAANVPANTAPSVVGQSGKLEAFNPTTMAGQWAQPAKGSLMGNLGFPSTTMNNFTIDSAAHEVTKGPTFTPGTYTPPVQHDESSYGPKTVNGTTTPAATTPNLVQAGGGSGYQGPLFVNDQYQPGLGTSLPVATPGLGMGANPSWYSQFSSPVWVDPKTGFIYSDAGGKNQLYQGGNKNNPYMAPKNWKGEYITA